MAAYNGKTPKRHVMYSNSKAIGWFDMGKLVFDYNNPEYKKHCTTIKKITVKDGKKKTSFQGVKKKLKQSQQLGCKVLFCQHPALYRTIPGNRSIRNRLRLSRVGWFRILHWNVKVCLWPYWWLACGPVKQTCLTWNSTRLVQMPHTVAKQCISVGRYPSPPHKKIRIDSDFW